MGVYKARYPENLPLIAAAPPKLAEKHIFLPLNAGGLGVVDIIVIRLLVQDELVVAEELEASADGHVAHLEREAVVLGVSLGHGLDELISLLEDLALDGGIDGINPLAQGDVLLGGEGLGAVGVDEQVAAGREQDLSEVAGTTLALLVYT